MKKSSIELAWKGADRCKNCAIRHLVLFADIPQEEFDRLHLPIDDINLEPGATLYRQDETMPFFYTIRTGLIKLVQTSSNGNQRIIRILGQGDLAGLEGLNDQALDHDAVTLDHVTVCRIPKSVINALERETPALHNTLIQRWQNALSSANTWITQLSTGNSKRRVAQLLLLLDERSLDDTFFLPKREDMGAMLGLTTESASKVTAEFRRQRLLKILPQNRAWIDREIIATEFD